MERDRMQIQNAYREKTNAAHDAFGGKNFTKLAKLLLEKGEIATKMYEIEGTDLWDIRTYGAYNAAGWSFEYFCDFITASSCYRLALTSCERIATNRSPEWQKNINHLKSLIERVEKK